MDFAVGNITVYQGQGIGHITAIDNVEVAGSSLEVYTVKMESGTIVRVPTSKAKAVGLRMLTLPEGVPAIYEVLRDRPTEQTEKTWNRRHRVYNDKLRQGAVTEIAEVIRDLSHLKFDKTLSYSEREMLEQARTLLIRELSLSTKRDEAEIAREIEGLLTAGRELTQSDK